MHHFNIALPWSHILPHMSNRTIEPFDPPAQNTIMYSYVYML